MPVEAQTGGEAEVGTELEFVLEITAGFVGAIVAVGIALEEGGGDEAIGSVGNDQALEELGKVGETDRAFVGALIAGVELSVGEAAAEGDGVLAECPDGVGRGHEAVLEDAGEGALGGGAAADVGGSVKDKVLVVGSKVTVIVDDGDAGKEGRAESVDGGVGGGCAGEAGNIGAKLLRSEGLVDGAVDLFANEAEDFDDAEIRFDDLRVGDARDLASGIEMLRETGEAGVGVGSDAGIVLIVILQGDSVL